MSIPFALPAETRVSYDLLAIHDVEVRAADNPKSVFLAADGARYVASGDRGLWRIDEAGEQLVSHELGYAVDVRVDREIAYVADQSCVELKSLKMYVWAYRNEGVFHEAVTNQILQDLVDACAPRFMRLTARFNVRGGIYTDIIVDHTAAGWTPPLVVNLPEAGDHL